MACTISIKGKEGFLVFPNIEKAKEYVLTNQLELREMLDPNSKEKKTIEYLDSKDSHANAIDRIKVANQRSYDETKNVLITTDISGWDSEEYHGVSDTYSLSVLLSDIMVSTVNSKGEVESKRLFPEFITGNYLNVLTIEKLLGKYIEQIITEDNITQLRNKFIDDSTPDAWVKSGVRYTAKDWIEVIRKNSGVPEFQLTDEELLEIDDEVTAVNEGNFRVMLQGELMHKLFETVIMKGEKNPNLEAIAGQKVTALFESFKLKYETHKEVPRSADIIRTLQEEWESEKAFKSYLKAVKKAKLEIEAKHKTDGKTITWLAEQRLTADLSKAIDGKTKVRGKIDAILLVDGVPNVIDLKVSRKPYAEWASEKIQKTDYQLYAYSELLRANGFRSHINTDLYTVVLDDEGLVKGQEWVYRTGPVTSNNRLSRNMGKIISKMEIVKRIDDKSEERATGIITELFGDGSTKGQKVLNVEQKKEHFRAYADKTLKDGKYKVTYTITNEAGKHVSKTKTFTKSEYDQTIEEIANEVVNSENSSFPKTFHGFRQDVQNYINGTIEISDFTVVAEADETDKPKLITQLLAILLKYKGTNSKLIESELGNKFNMIIIESELGLDCITCTASYLDTPWDNKNKKAKLLSKITTAVNDETDKTVGNVETIKSLIILNEIKGNSDKIGKVIPIKLGSPKGMIMTVKDMERNIQTVSKFIEGHSTLSNGFSDKLTGKFYDGLTTVLYEIGKFNESNKASRYKPKLNFFKVAGIINEKTPKAETIESILKGERGIEEINDFIKTLGSEYPNVEDLISTKIQILGTLRDKLLLAYPELLSNLDRVQISPEAVLLRVILDAINVYNKSELNTESDLPEYDLLLGSFLRSIDTIPNQNAAILRTIASKGWDKIGRKFNNDVVPYVRAWTENLKKSHGYGTARHLVIGDSTSNYKNLYRRNSDGTFFEDDLYLKNPWDENSDMTVAEKTYVKNILFMLHRYRKNLKSPADVVESSFRNDEDYLVPLTRTRGLDSLQDVRGGISLAKFKSQSNHIVNEAKGMRDTLVGNVEARRKASQAFGRMHNELAIKDRATRKEMISREGGIEVFSLDLETITELYALHEISAAVYNTEVIPQVQYILYASAFDEVITGEEVAGLHKFIKAFMTSNIYGDAIMDPTAQKLYKYIAPMRAIAAKTALSFNFLNAPRELLMGLFTGISRAAFSTYGKDAFNAKEYAKAVGIVMYDAPNFVVNVTKIELLNEKYRIANMSISEIPLQVTSNKTGVFALGSRWSSASLTAPDYFNRMTMFVAQMIHDGSWDAYELENTPDGVKKLKYNMAKDKRFELYVKHQGDLSRVPVAHKEKFKEQKALYEAMRDDFNRDLDPEERISSSNEGNINFLPDAYNRLQRDSFKSFADLAFGYYDNEVKALFFKTAIGATFKQFGAYLSAKNTTYFQVRTNKTARGSYEDLKTNDGQTIWSFTRINEDGTMEVETVTQSELDTKYAEYKDIAQKKKIWTGTYMEGIANSYWHLVKDVFQGSYETLKGNHTDVWKRIAKEYFTRGDIRYANLGQGIWDLLLMSLMVMVFRMISFDNPEESGVSYKAQLENSSGLLQNVYWMSTKASEDFSAWSLIKNGYLTWEPASLSIVTGAINNYATALGDPDLNIFQELMDGTIQSVGAFRWVKPAWNKYIERQKE